MESLNPAGSIKLKTAVGLINDLQARGLLGPDTILIESSSGNLGVALAMICAERGIPFTCVVDPNSSSHNIRMMRSYGAEVIQVEIPDANGGFLGTRIELIRQKWPATRAMSGSINTRMQRTRAPMREPRRVRSASISAMSIMCSSVPGPLAP